MEGEMFASGWIGSLGAVVMTGLAFSGGAAAQDARDDNANARAQIESQQSYRGGRGRGEDDGWRGNRGDGWRERGRHDRHDHWDRRWRGGGWGWVAPPVIWAPPPRFYYNDYRRYRRDRFDAWDAVALGLFGVLVVDALSDNQRRSHDHAYSSALRAPIGQDIVWNDNAAGGTVRVTRDGYAGNKYCREFQQTITVNGQRENAWGISCQEPDGSWRIVPQN
jgi:surface antigen